MDVASDTRQRILDSSAELFRREGFGVGLKQIATRAQAPFGSLYHHFPGGKDELGEAAIRAAEGYYRDQALSTWDPSADLPTNIRAMFAGAARYLADSDYADACPIATIALEVSSTNERLRVACDDVFAGWLADAAGLFALHGFDESTQRLLAVQLLTAIEGGFILARVHRDTAPLLTAGEGLARLVEAMTPAAPRTRRRPRPTASAPAP